MKRGSAVTRVGSGRLRQSRGRTLEHELNAAAELQIIKGNVQGDLTPDDIRQRFPEIHAEPDQISRIFAEHEKDFEEVEQVDEEMLLGIETMESVSIDESARDLQSLATCDLA